MKIGRLNDQLNELIYTVKYENSDHSPLGSDNCTVKNFDDFNLKWNTIRCRPIEIKVSFDVTAFIERIVINTGEKTALTSVTVKDTSSATVARYSAETGKTISTRSIQLECALFTKSFSLIIDSSYSDVEILSIDLYGYTGEATTVFPIPKIANYGEYLPHNYFSSYSADSEHGYCAGEILKEKYFEKTSVTLTATKDNADIRFITDTSLSDNAYKLKITEDQTQIFASDLRGFVMGAETFIKLTDKNGVSVLL